MVTPAEYVGDILTSLNVALHTLGAILLIQVYQKVRESKNQPLFLLNLSISELASNVIGLTTSVAAYLIDDVISLAKVQIIVGTFDLGFNLAYFFAMYLITGDRLAACLLGLRYKSICTHFRVKIAITCTWIISIVLVPAVLNGFCWHIGFLNFYFVFGDLMKFLSPTLSSIYLLFAIATYASMFRVFVTSRRKSSLPQKQSALHFFRHSKFYVSILLISSFLLLMIIPEIVIFSIVLRNRGRTHQVTDPTPFYVKILLSRVSDIVDSIIYIFFYSPVQRSLTAHIRSLYHLCIHRGSSRLQSTESTNNSDSNGLPSISTVMSSCDDKIETTI